jgi:hypothetical protein
MIYVSVEKMKKWNSYQKRAKRNNIEFKISDDTFFHIIHTQCYICGKNGVMNELGIDRINNELGYIDGNVAACCWECNKAKGNLKSLKFLQWLKRLQPKHPLITKGHCQPKGYFNGKHIHIDVKINETLLAKLNSKENIK